MSKLAHSNQETMDEIDRKRAIENGDEDLIMAEIPEKDVTQQTLESKLTFGKYKGRTVDQIIKINPQYLQWAVKNIDWFDLDRPARKVAQRAINLAKQNARVRQEAWAWGVLPSQRNQCWGGLTDDDMRR